MAKPHRPLSIRGTSMSAPLSPAEELGRMKRLSPLAELQYAYFYAGVPYADGIPTRPERFFKIKNSGDEEWGNVFLTSEWNLYVDWTKQQHDAAMERLGIDHLSVIVSGSVRIVGGRTSVQVR